MCFVSVVEVKLNYVWLTLLYVKLRLIIPKQGVTLIIFLDRSKAFGFFSKLLESNKV